MKIASIADLRIAAQRRLPRFLFDYVDGGSADETTMRRNIADLASVQLRQRVLVDVDHIDPSAIILGQRYQLPVALGPVGLAGMLAPRGEIQTARAAARFGVPFCLSTTSVCSLAEMIAADSPPSWFQLYVVRDRGFVSDLMRQAAGAGCTTLLLTVDTPRTGVRRRDLRSGLIKFGFSDLLRRFGQAMLRPKWAWQVGIRGRPHQLGNFASQVGSDAPLDEYMVWTAQNMDKSLTWDSIAFIREQWKGPLLIKGILDVEDSRLALQTGVDGIVVSNHGGRQLDGAASTAQALPAIADTIAGEMTLLVDGGIRSGVDVLKMLALGADGVLLGRAWAYALGAMGESGVSQLLSMIDSELRVAMALSGCRTVREITRATISSH